MSDIYTINWWEQLRDKHWHEYEADCEQSGARPRWKDFMVWSEEHNLVPEYMDED